jgi:MFS family permease
MVNKYGVNPKFAGSIPALLPFGTIILTPFFGNLYDRKGKGATIMLIGSVMLLIVHSFFAVPFLNHSAIAVVLIMLLGVTFSLVPSAMWPSVPKIIPERQLGTAYALIFWVQNIGLMLVPVLIGWVLEKYCRVLDESGNLSHYDYTIPMMIFAATGFLSIFVAYMLKAEDKNKRYGLELPNIQK